MKFLLDWWRRFITPTETLIELRLLRAENKRVNETNQVLEEELALARKEIRALENTALSQAGVAPLPPHEEVKPTATKRTRKLTWQQRQRMYAAATAPKEKEDGRTERRTEPV